MSEAAGYDSSAARDGSDFDGSPDGASAVAHEVQSHARFAAGAYGEPGAIILNFQHQAIVTPG